MTAVHILATDFATRSFQIGKTAAGGTVLFNRMVSRAKLETALREHAPALLRSRRARRAISGDDLRYLQLTPFPATLHDLEIREAASVDF